MVTGHGPEIAEKQIGIIEAAKAAGAGYLVKVSGGKAVVKPDAESVVFRGHYAVEEHLKTSGLKWAILRPGLFIQNAFTMAPTIKNDGKMVFSLAKNVPLCFIDVRDTGALGARVLRDPERYAGKAYDFSGVKSNYEEFTNVFSEVLGRPITYVASTLKQAEQGTRSHSLADWLITHLAVARDSANRAFAEEVTQPIRDILGRVPLTTKQFVQDHRLPA